MSQTIEGNTVEERVGWAIRRLQNLGNTIKDGTKSDIVAVLEEAQVAPRSLWNLIKDHLDEYVLLEVADNLPQFSEEARRLSRKVTERNARERRLRDDFLEMDDYR